MGRSGKRSPVFQKLLLRRVRQTYGGSIPPVDQLIAGLRAKYPEYCRLKPQLFTRMVSQTLASDNNKNKRKLSSNNVDDDDNIPSSSSSLSKKAKRMDNKEQRSDVACGEMESQSELWDSESSSDDGEGYKSAGLTSEDEVYDLTKSMIRNKYSMSKIDKKSKKNVETDKKVDSLMEDKSVRANGPRFKDIGGMDDVLEELRTELIPTLKDPELLAILGVRPIAGILLHGPPGCGKTKLAHAIANESGLPFYKISATDLVSGVSGASEENIRELFSKAYRTAPSIIFIDEVDAIASKRENLQRGMEKRIVAQLMTCMDPANTEDAKPGDVLVIAATNRPHDLDPALRRPGRFDREITLGVPDENARIKILSVLKRNVKVEGAFDIVKIARSTPGFVGADLAGLVNRAGYIAVGRTTRGRKLEITDTEENEDRCSKTFTREEKDNLSIMMSDTEKAAKLVQPSSKREGFSSIPDVKWEDVGGLDGLRSELRKNIIRPIKYPKEHEVNGIETDTGFLLYGPPGCGKTLIAKALANEAGANFIHIQGPEILNKYVGETEKALRTIFSCARTCSPCILFFDEIDAITKERGNDGAPYADRLVNQFLTELDGGDQRKGVYVIGATNRLEVIDQALLRPGRLTPLYVPLPDQDERWSILKTLSRNTKLDADVDLMAIARACVNFSGADLSKLMNKAKYAAFDEKMCKIEAADLEGTSGSSSQSYERGMPVTTKAIHIEQVLGKMKPSISHTRYNKLNEAFRRSHEARCDGSSRALV